MWLPIALADIYSSLVALIRPNLKDPGSLKIPKLSDTLKAWCLPMLSSAIKAEEDEREAINLFESVQNLAKKQNG